MTRILGDRSRKNLIGVHPNLVRVIVRALEIGPIDFTVIEGLRTDARQNELFAQGRTMPGPIVTWTHDSKHKKQAKSGFGEAGDLAHIVGGVVRWEDCDKIAVAMFQASEELGIPIRWGADWDQDGKPREKGETDSPHFELARSR